jgi:Gpi18-like mannosyltransferase
VPAISGLVVVLALAVRLSVFRYETFDYIYFYRPWHDFIVSHGGFSALRYEFSDLNAPYRYFLVAIASLPISPLVGMKAISVLFELLIAFFTYRVVALRYASTWPSYLAAGTVFLLPTVVLNGSMWAQGDALYTAFSLGALYYVLTRRPWWACVFFGLAIAFKLQAVFLFPLLLVLVLGGRIPWRCLTAIPVVYLLLDVPALLAGAAPGPLLTVYVKASTFATQLTMGAPSVWQFFRGEKGLETMRTPGVLFAGALVLIGCLLVLLSRAELTDTRILLLGTVSVVLLPFVLPSMHDRYFYLADVLTVILAFHLPRRTWYLPVAVQFTSLLCYIPFLFWALPGNEPVDYRLLAGIEGLVLIALLYEAVRQLRPDLVTRRR